MLKLVELVVWHGGRPINQPINMVSKKGDLILISGDNGSGKTTILRTIAGLHTSYEGKIVGRIKNNIGLVPQGTVPFRSLRLREAAVLMNGYSPSSWSDVSGALALAGLQEKRLGIMSGGEAQRAKVALALMSTHQVLLLDEPFDGIDGDQRIRIASTVAQRATDKITLLVDHSPRPSLPTTAVVRIARH